MIENITSNPIYIIGDTPFALMLSAKLSLAGINTYLLGAEKSFKKDSPLTLKEENSSVKNTIYIQTTSLIREPAQLIILCLDSHSISAGLTYFSKKYTKETPVISFCHTSTPKIIEEIIGKPIIPAYFDGWIKKSYENTFTYLGCPTGITISQNSKQPFYPLLSQIFSKTDLKINFNGNDEQNFWNDFILYAACSLFSLQNGPHLRDIAKKANYRQTLNTIFDELLQLVPQTLLIDKENIITKIYQTPTGYTFPIINEKETIAQADRSFIKDIIRNQPNYQPSRFSTINTILQTYI